MMMTKYYVHNGDADSNIDDNNDEEDDQIDNISSKVRVSILLQQTYINRPGFIWESQTQCLSHFLSINK